ncbi:MAG: L-aspartate oxidase [Bacteroidales bacterium]
MRKEVDFLVIGSGIAGLSYALKVAPYGNVCIVTKDVADETATKYAQGGIAAVMYAPDTYEKHIRDTLIAGDGLCDPEIVRITITESTDRIRELIEWGAEFDKTPGGKYDLGREGGHSENRVLHHKDATGAEIIRALLHQVRKNPNIELLERHFAVDLITQHHLGIEVTRDTPGIKCYGAFVLEPVSGNVITILSRTTLLATGGSGNIYSVTTNPPVATGDGFAMAYRAKAWMKNMEFVQFHPTSLYNPGERPSFLITEALRGFGAVLKNHQGEEFMQRYDSRGSLAPRDIVARAIDNEMKKSGMDHVWLDCRHLPAGELVNRFPGIHQKCLSIGIDIRKDMIPVTPAAHYFTGGVTVDKNGCTTIENLYATGETACTGLHGANRLASNSLLESAVFSHRAAMHAINRIHHIDIEHGIPDWNAEGVTLNEEIVLIRQSVREVQQIMTYYVGIVRSNLRLQRALDRLEILYRETEELYNKSVISEDICELRNMINVAYLVIKMAQQRKESRGLHYSLDYPEKEETGHDSSG